jgi:hypothetical protein
VIRYLFDTEGSMVKADSIHVHPDNDNNGDIDEILASIETNGVYRKLVVSQRTRNICAGNHTYMALLELNAEYVPVEWIDVDEWTELRILAVDNWVARLARPDPALTAILIKRIIDNAPIRDRTPLDLSGVGREMLNHRIKCPECGHEWSRSGTEF